jgi:CDP-paratose 2-epimerase
MKNGDTAPGAPALVRRRPILVTGGAGFIGSNLADRFAREGHDVLVYDALARPGVDANLAWLRKRHPDKISAVIGDVRDETAAADAAADAQAVFHMAAQVAVTTSLADPREDFDINVRGTLNLLDALRKRHDPAPLVFASTNKVYGDLADVELDKTNDAYVPRDPGIRATGIGESRPLDFHTPYGCSKGAADQYVLDYARSFGVPTCVLRMSCIYGQRQMGTEDQGWVAHFLIRALKGEPISIYGDGCQVRDVLDIGDAVEAYASAWRRIDAVQGRAFNLGGGPANAISLKQLLTHIESIVGRPVEAAFSDWRAGDQRYYVSDTRLATRELGLRPPTPWRKGVATLARWLQEERGLSPSEPAQTPRTAEVLS